MDIKLAAVIIHDIKNALGVLEGELEDMTRSPTREQALLAHETCTSLHEKLIGFLTLYKASSQGLNARIEPVNPEDFLNGLLRVHAGGRPELRVTIDRRDMPILGFFDENLVGLALEAALQNATRFARTCIEIGCVKDDAGYLAFTVRDDGSGLGTKEEKPSTGLGMELCRAIAQAHRKGDQCGSVSLGNRPEGGAEFRLRVP
ncbi:MAG TPA: HAMP domain-containing sensor histidine kinase [Noviherbaspirillum sp.]|uniref:sensor histidine kinase n=1 Tax=Noviherbaspirillum sp. TaxID=1926288 RepID=UPI002B497C86|nr:HAMP domain-containing sensor histidine kinase [Noviherbaspirillum sp.]HJV85953.1 HAMP domain-containing sensor histidine kinase [Noviherbaspirillum sp.]